MAGPVRLTSLAHGGGCGCKLSPSVLRDILKSMPPTAGFPELLVGAETSDDAAVWRLSDEQALVATTDFFMPVVDDPYDFGRIAAANALSDIYAMGGKPFLALAIVGMPVNTMPVETISAILEGGASVCAKAGIPIAGGHSIDSAEPIYGLVALGLVHPDHVKKNSGGQPGDVLILTKPLGVGILSAALKQDKLDEAGYAALIASTTRLNSIGAEVAKLEGVTAMTDVTGFGLIGHALEMARGAGVSTYISADAPLLPGVEALARAGVRTGASGRNWASYSDVVVLPDRFPDWRRDILCDPQTSGGLLIAAAPDAASAVLDRLIWEDASSVAVVGRLSAGPPSVVVEG